MPLYEYKCLDCHRHTEKIQKFSDPEITHCPHCGGTLQRVITAPAIAFKGGGWYADGYGNAKPKSSGDAGDSKGDPSAGKGDPSAGKGDPSASKGENSPGKKEGSESSPAANSDAGSKGSSTSDSPGKPAPAAAPASTPSSATPAKS